MKRVRGEESEVKGRRLAGAKGKVEGGPSWPPRGKPKAPTPSWLRTGVCGESAGWGRGAAGGALTHDLVLLQVDGLERGQRGERLREVPELVPGQVDGPEVLQGADLTGEAMQEIPFQVELCRGRGRTVRGGTGARDGGLQQSRDDRGSERPPGGQSRLCTGHSALPAAPGPAGLCSPNPVPRLLGLLGSSERSPRTPSTPQPTEGHPSATGPSPRSAESEIHHWGGLAPLGAEQVGTPSE